MGVYLPNMEMPTTGMCKTITIFDDGAVVEGNGSEKLGIAIPIPSHGRLIDADALAKNVTGAIYHSDLRAAPTIIPAEEGE